ncbi:hypothetical protein N665_1995s0002 [Sinapis alba]|nr:hypothetical protein N665_1995s0002 [Sinapis alba]
MCWCFLSTTEFCWGVSGQEWKASMPLVLNKVPKVNSGALSVLTDLMVVLNWVSIIAMKAGKICRTSDLAFNKYIQVARL